MKDQNKALKLREELSRTKDPKKRKKLMDEITSSAKYSHMEFEGVE